MCLGNVSEDFSASNMKRAELGVCVYDLSVDYRAFDTSNVTDVHKYLMKKHKIK